MSTWPLSDEPEQRRSEARDCVRPEPEYEYGDDPDYEDELAARETLDGIADD